MRKSVLALLAFSAAFAGAAHAADCYVGGAVVQSHLSTHDLSEQDSTGVKLIGGHQFTDNLAVEASLGFNNGFKADSARVSTREVGVGLVAQVPVAAKLSAFGKVGLEYQDVHGGSQGSSTGTNPVFGVGVKYALDKAWTVRAEGEYLNRTADSSVPQTRYSLGVQYGF